MAVAAGAGMAHALSARLEAEDKLDPRLRYEIVAGELVIRGAPSIRHERIVSVLMRHLTGCTHEHGGEVFAGAAVKIADHHSCPTCRSSALTGSASWTTGRGRRGRH